MDPPGSELKKVRKLSRRGKLIGKEKGLNEKEELVHALMVKCDKTEEEVLEAYDTFHLKYEEGFISKEEYTNCKTVSINKFINILSNMVYFPGTYES